jgi:hypothetical protein
LEEKVDVKAQLKTLINALQALAPSRNYFIQFFTLLPMDFRVASKSFPELFEDEKIRNILTKVFGISVGSTIEIGSGLAHTLKLWSETVRSTFEKDETRESISSYIGEEIPNIEKEWLEVKLEIIRSEPTYGKITLQAYHKIIEAKQLTVKELVGRMKCDESTIRTALEILRNFRLIEPVGYGEETYKISGNLEKYSLHLLTYLPKLVE